MPTPAFSPAGDSERRLRLYQLVSPALPVGAFSYSEGLEALCQAGRLPGVEAVAAWLRAELRWGLLPLEAAALPLQMADLTLWRESGAERQREAARVRVIERDGWWQALREAAEVRAQQRQMGASLLALLDHLGHPLPPGPTPQPLPALAWPTAWAWALVALEIPALEGVEAYLHAWVSNQLSAAVRLVPLGSSDAQGLLLGLAPLIAERAAELQGAPAMPDWSGGVGASLAQLSHGELYSRLFRS